MSNPRDRQRGRRTCRGEVDALHLDQVWARALDRDLEDQEIEAEEPEGATAEGSGLTDVACAVCGELLTGPIKDRFIYEMNGDLDCIELFHAGCAEGGGATA